MTAAAGLLAGWAADGVVGDPRRGHPVAGFGRLAVLLERYTWRDRRLAGVVHTGVLVLTAAAVARGVERAAGRVPYGRPAVVALVVWSTLGGRSLASCGRQMASLIEAADLEGARMLAPSLVGRDPAHLDEAELCRAAVESIAENTADAVVGVLWWSVLAGPAGAAAYRATNTLDAMIGHRTARYERYGWAAARLDDVLTWPAARLGAWATVLLAPLVGGSSRQAWRVLRRSGACHPSPNSGRMEAAFAGALGVRLGGQNTYAERVERRPHLGDGRPPGPQDARRAADLSLAVGGACALLAGIALAWKGRRRR